MEVCRAGASLPKPAAEPCCFMYEETAGKDRAKAASGDTKASSARKQNRKCRCGRNSVRLSSEKETHCTDPATTAEEVCAGEAVRAKRGRPTMRGNMKKFLTQKRSLPAGACHRLRRAERSKEKQTKILTTFLTTLVTT